MGLAITGKFKAEDLAGVKNLPKQVSFALAKTLTQALQEGREASDKKTHETFTIRTSWANPGNRFATRTRPARKDTLEGDNSSLAWWREDHEKGETREPQGQFLAVPTPALKRTKRDLISVSTRKKIFDKASKTFFRLKTKKGEVIATRLNSALPKEFKLAKGGGIAIVAGLESKVQIKKNPTFFEPMAQVAIERFPILFNSNMAEAIKTAK